MKFIISESQIKNAFFEYMHKFYPEYEDLDRYAIKRSGDGVNYNIIGWRFRDKNDSEVFRWMDDTFYNPETKLRESDKHLVLNRTLWGELEITFGDEFMEYIIDWFEHFYNLPVDHITF